MSGLKRIKENHPNIGYLIAAIISFILYAVAVILIFTLPKGAKPTTGGRSRTISPSDITESTSLSPTRDLVFDYGVGSDIIETFKVSTTASAVSLGPYDQNKYLYMVSEDAEYNIEINYTLIGLTASDFNFQIYLSDGDGNNQIKLNDSQYTFTADSNVANASYLTNGVTYLHHIVITYQVN